MFVAGIVLIFARIPGAALVYSVLGLVIFAGFTLWGVGNWDGFARTGTGIWGSGRR